MRILVRAMLVVSAMTAVAGADEAKLEAIRHPLGRAADEREMLAGLSPDRLPEVIAKAGACVKAVDAALAAGVASTHELKINDIVEMEGSRIVKVPGRPEDRLASLATIKAFCAAIPAAARLANVTNVLGKTAKIWREEFQNAQEEYPEEYANGVASECDAAVATALAGGIPPATTIDLGEDGALTLAEAKPKLCDRLRKGLTTVIDAREAAERAAYEARVAPYRKLLKGDKLKLFLERGDLAVYGKNCAELAGPAAYSKASSWYEILVDDNGAVPMWTTRQYKFKGGKLAVRGFERTGAGRRPPSKACPG